MAHGVVFQTGTFRRGHPQQERQIEVGYTKNLRFSTSISEIPIPNTEVFQNTDTKYRTDMKKIPTKILNTDTDSKYRYRPSSSVQQSTRYLGALSCRHRCTVTLRLYWTRSGMSSQCNSSCSRCDRPWSNFRVAVTRRAAACSKRCSLSVMYLK